MGASSPFLTDSPQAAAISSLFVGILVLCAVVFTLVTLLSGYALWRFRTRPGAPSPVQRFGDNRFEFAWTLAPLVAVIVIFFFTASTMAKVDPAVPPGAQPAIAITAHQWWWEIRYPAAGVVTANELHLPAGKTLLVGLRAADVVHDFWVPALGRKVDLVPGHPNHLFVSPSEPGTLFGACAEYCGAEHAWMRIRVDVQAPAEFDAWLREQARPPSPPTGAPAEEGARLFQRLTCVNCHTIAGTAAHGRIGPDLGHFASRATLGAQVLDSGRASLARWLADPQAVKPGCHMPNLQLASAQVAALTSYLEELR